MKVSRSLLQFLSAAGLAHRKPQSSRETSALFFYAIVNHSRSKHFSVTTPAPGGGTELCLCRNSTSLYSLPFMYRHKLITSAQTPWNRLGHSRQAEGKAGLPGSSLLTRGLGFSSLLSFPFVLIVLPDFFMKHFQSVI